MNITKVFYCEHKFRSADTRAYRLLIKDNSDITQNTLFIRRSFRKFDFQLLMKKNTFDHINLLTVHGELPIFL